MAWRIKKDGHGMGGLMCPPGHPNHEYYLEEGPPSNPSFMGSIECDDEYIPEDIRARCKEILEKAELVCSEDWLANVYSYFKNCYSKDGVSRAVDQCVTFGKFWGNEDEPRPPAEHSLAVMCVREYFPDHEPRLDLLDKPDGYGQKECAKCGTRCQYEARFDAWKPFDGALKCSDGEAHEVRRAS